MPTAIVTGASRGLGLALAAELGTRGWALVVDARNAGDLAVAGARLQAAPVSAGSFAVDGVRVVAVAGDVADPAHRSQLIAAATELGGLDLLVNNASTLGATPLPPLAGYPVGDLRTVFEVNSLAPLALLQEAMPLLRGSGDPRVLNVTSDASVEHYPGWGGYGAAKAALDHLGGTLAAEEPWLRVFTVDPGDMRTRMHQDAFPGEDISDRPLPEEVVPLLVGLIESSRPSGRYRASELVSLVGRPA
jgi:NAD(P)-dependent dehydrogenase (short-subunit alcohol dehydrogenase family)